MKQRPYWCPKKSSGSWTFSLWINCHLLQYICITTGHTSENVLYMNGKWNKARKSSSVVFCLISSVLLQDGIRIRWRQYRNIRQAERCPSKQASDERHKAEATSSLPACTGTFNFYQAFNSTTDTRTLLFIAQETSGGQSNSKGKKQEHSFLDQSFFQHRCTRVSILCRCAEGWARRCGWRRWDWRRPGYYRNHSWLLRSRINFRNAMGCKELVRVSFLLLYFIRVLSRICFA